jgi:hypothetical protein
VLNAAGNARGSGQQRTVLRYEAARAALAECRGVDEVLAIKNDAERLKLFARQAKDRHLVADAAEIQLRATRHLGTLLAKAKEAGQIAKGRPKEIGYGANPLGTGPASELPRVTLREAGIDKRLADKARKSAAMQDGAFESAVEALRARIIAGDALVVEVESKPINGARAVMGSRQEPDDSLDFSPTPPWGTRALFECVLPAMNISRSSLTSVHEPACGEGHMAEVLREYFSVVAATDVFDYGYGDGVHDFLADDFESTSEWIITNPPFKEKAEQFALKAIERARVGAAIFARLQWLETIGRYERLFRDHPPTQIAFFCERVNLCMGRWAPDGGTATAYIWLVWIKGRAPRAPFWIPPGQRQALTRADDAERFTANPVKAATCTLSCTTSFSTIHNAAGARML